MDALTTHVDHRIDRLQHEATNRRLGDASNATPSSRASTRIAVAIATILLTLAVAVGGFGASLTPGGAPDQGTARAALAIIRVIAHR